MQYRVSVKLAKMLHKSSENTTTQQSRGQTTWSGHVVTTCFQSSNNTSECVARGKLSVFRDLAELAQYVGRVCRDSLDFITRVLRAIVHCFHCVYICCEAKVKVKLNGFVKKGNTRTLGEG